MTHISSRVDDLAPVNPSGARAVDPAAAPIVVDLGKQRRRDIKQLKNGAGPLVADIGDVLAEIRAELSTELDGRPLAPIVLIYSKKSQKSRDSVIAPIAQA